MTTRILIGDVREQLKTLADESVHCVVTSPPYWGLRDYGTAQWEGGDADCPHEPPQEWIDHNFNAKSAFGNGAATQSAAAKSRWYKPDGSCRCGASRKDSQLGMEATYQEHVEVMVDVFREVKRVLRKDGTLWLNYGDSYATSGARGHGGWDGNNKNPDGSPRQNRQSGDQWGGPTAVGGLKPKDLCGIPWRVAFALQADGWYLRQDIVWAKPNPMPESVKDRCTKAHEYVFLLTKSARYYFDADAIREAHTGPSPDHYGVRNEPKPRNCDDERVRTEEVAVGNAREYNPLGRNKRSVWEIATSPFPEAHFATFPPELPEICIKAGTSEKGCCGKCGKPWVRETATSLYSSTYGNSRKEDVAGSNDQKQREEQFGTRGFAERKRKETKTLGWAPSCECGHFHFAPFDPIPCTVLDPFFGAGTTGLVADRLQRNCIGVELNPAYAELARNRISADSSLFAEIL